MNVTLLTRTGSIQDMENFAVKAALTCHANTDKQVNNQEFLTKIIKVGHENILEHIYLTYSIKGISRALLQELGRHRHLTLSVESTRHTLKKMLPQDEFYDIEDVERIANMIDNGKAYEECISDFIDFALAHPDMPNDELKYFLPEFWPTNLILTSNIRELRHILNLRTAPQALKEFRNLAHELFNVVPEQFKYLLQDCVHQEANNG